MEEAELVLRMKEGDSEAFYQLYEKYKVQVHRTACLLCGNSFDGEDVMQETFFKVYTQCRKIKKNESFSYWMYSILYRTAWQQIRKGRKELPDEEIIEKAEIPDGQDLLEQVLEEQENKELWQAICQLNYNQKTVIILYYYEELSVKEIANILNCMEGTVKSRLYFARKKLQQKLMAGPSGREYEK